MNATHFARRRFAGALLLACLTLAGWPHTSAAEPAGRVVHIGSKSFTESVILAEVLAALGRSQQHPFESQHQAGLGGTQLVFSALEKGEIDCYPEYTGTLSQVIFAGQGLRTDEQLREALARRGIAMSPRLGFNNTYALGMKEAVAERLGVRNISDLLAHAREIETGQLKFGVSEEFLYRPDGWPAVASAYGLTMAQPRGLDHNLAYRGLDEGQLHVTDLYSTDAEVQFYRLRVLEDDRGCFPRYHCVFLYRQDAPPAAVQAIADLADKIDSAAMAEMNARVQLDRLGEARVASEFVRDQLGLKTPIPSDDRSRRMLHDLGQRTLEHLALVLVSLAAAVLIGIPLGIAAYRRPRLGAGILATVGVIQTIPSLALLVFLVPLLSLGFLPAVVALTLYSLLPIVRNTFTGLSEIPAQLRESAEVLGLSPRARLRLVELPIASRSILAGVKTAAVINVGMATIGGLIGAGGYGQPILTGIRLNDTQLLLLGAVPAALMAVVMQWGFDQAERWLIPAGLRVRT